MSNKNISKHTKRWFSCIYHNNLIIHINRAICFVLSLYKPCFQPVWFKPVDNWRGGGTYLYSCSAQLVSFEMVCFDGLRTPMYVPPPPNYRASYGPGLITQCWIKDIHNRFQPCLCIHNWFCKWLTKRALWLLFPVKNTLFWMIIFETLLIKH